MVVEATANGQAFLPDGDEQLFANEVTAIRDRVQRRVADQQNMAGFLEYQCPCGPAGEWRVHSYLISSQDHLACTKVLQRKQLLGKLDNTFGTWQTMNMTMMMTMILSILRFWLPSGMALLSEQQEMIKIKVGTKTMTTQDPINP